MSAGHDGCDGKLIQLVPRALMGCEMPRQFLEAERMVVTNPPKARFVETERPSAVLLVARDRSLDESCRRTLSDAGVQCIVSVPDSDHALRLLDNRRLFDAVVIGVGAGDVEAVKLAGHMQRYRADTPTVVVSPIGALRLPGAIAQSGSPSSRNEAEPSKVFGRLIRRLVSGQQLSRRRPRS